MSNTAENPKRSMQLSLRGLLGLLSVACVFFGCLGWFVHRANRQHRVVQWVKKSHGYVQYENDWSDNHFESNYFANVVKVHIENTDVSDVTPLTDLTSLECLRVRYTHSDVTPLANLTKLKTLCLTSTQVRDVTPLVNLKSLEWLELRFTQVRDVTPLANLTNLDYLDLSNTQVNKENCERLQMSLPSLTIKGP